MSSPLRDLLDIRQLYTLTKATFVMMMLMISNFHLHGTENHLDSPSSKNYGHFRCQTTNSQVRAWNIYGSSPFSRKKFLSLCSIVKTTEWNGLIKIDN